MFIEPMREACMNSFRSSMCRWSDAAVNYNHYVVVEKLQFVTDCDAAEF